MLDGLDLDIEGGEAVALVGATASGKTTVARLIPRFYDVHAGHVRIDGADVRDVRLREVRRSVGLVFEDTFLFSDSVRNNIAFADPEAPERSDRACGPARGRRRVHPRAARGLRVDHRRARLFVVGRATAAHRHRPSGAGRSAGARSSTTRPSSVDPSKEHEIRAALAEVMQGRTTIIIAHRPATIALADRVVLLDGGKIVADGTHERLLATSPRYREVLARAALEVQQSGAEIDEVEEELLDLPGVGD